MSKNICKRLTYISILFLLFLSSTIFFISCPTGKNISFALVRYNADGSIDTSFGKDGFVITDIKDHNKIFSLTLQPDGKIIAAGTSDGKYAIVRYLPDGSIDIDFADKGKFVADFGADYALIKKVIVSSDGKILAAGYHSIRDGKEEKSSNFSIIRLNNNGIPDSTFGYGGFTLVYPKDQQAKAYTIATQSDGKILIAGEYNSVFQIIRYNIDGSMDTTFGESSGKNTIYMGIEKSDTQIAMEIMVKQDDNIVLAGVADNKIIKVNFDKDGNYDSSSQIKYDFISKYGPYFEANAIYITPDEDIIIAGATVEDQIYVSFALLKLRLGLDTDVDPDSRTIIKRISRLGPDVANAIAIHFDNKIILGGTSAYDYALVRYNWDGTIDKTFGQYGTVTTEFGLDDVIQAIVIQPDGKILAGGYSDSTSGVF